MIKQLIRSNELSNKPGPSCYLSSEKELSCLKIKARSLPGPPLKMASNPSPEVKAILKLTPALTTALSNEPLGVANTLLSEGLISSEVYSKVLVSTYSAAEKAAIMIDSVRKVVEITPSKFTEFLDILSKVTCAKEVVESLRSIYQDELIHQRSHHQFSVPSNSVSFTRTTPPSSVNTMSLISKLNNRAIPFTDDALSGEKGSNCPSWNDNATHQNESVPS